MLPSVSIFLDLLRFLAALTVAFGHLTKPRFSSGWPDLSEMGVMSVGIFFVLSGFVIRHVSKGKEHNFEKYAVARLARIYSVLVPAVILTILCDFISYHVDPSFYQHYVANSTKPFLRVLRILFFVNEAYGHEVALFSNTPVWSLGYEVPYYFAYGFLYFLSGKIRTFLTALVFLITGPKVLILFPTWLCGAWLYDKLQKIEQSRVIGMALLHNRLLIKQV